eukprot:CAMPEP_0181188150 /NCGR_PEP_ID=MMETSP1096-20121128/10955_1 /TAXON_ID=156174 ORGANISM="Chrysochromulina ericina, Strain CCMP281" /NCGR_SAMPLE_ID=MMETSP1096 /ASSEMBLY_ACC=CAM_ASM_000453 /LENGTH=59 /DNA_ID=CAMNT_0023277177 /DNA_START=75 /DNA_END=251 /DNA_ORIENTATION=+
MTTHAPGPNRQQTWHLIVTVVKVEAVLSRMVFSMPVAVTSTEPSLALSFTVTSVSPAAA